MDSCKEDITIDGELNMGTQLLCDPFFGILPLEYSELLDIDTMRTESEMMDRCSDTVTTILKVFAIKATVLQIVRKISV